jgi:hypothetical protein
MTDADFCGRDEQILRAHLDVVVTHEDQAAGRKLSGRIVAAGRTGDTRGEQRHDRDFLHLFTSRGTAEDDKIPPTSRKGCGAATGRE